MKGRLSAVAAAVVAAFALAAPALADQDVSIIADACAGCHGTDAKSPGAMPGFSDKNAAAIGKVLHEYKSGAKESTVMDRIMKGFSDAQVDAIAQFYGAGK